MQIFFWGEENIFPGIRINHCLVLATVFLRASVVLCVSICDWCHCGAAIIIQMGTI